MSSVIYKKGYKPVNKDKLYATMLMLAWAMVIACVLLKFMGAKSFHMPDFTYEYHATTRRTINYIFYMLNSLLFSRILIKRKLHWKDCFVIISIMTPAFIISLFDSLKVIKIIMECLSFYIIGLLFMRKEKWYKIMFECAFLLVAFTIYQVLALLYRNINVNIYVGNWVIDKLLLIDFYIMIFLTYLTSLKGGYLYGRWFKFLVNFSKHGSNEESVQSNIEAIQKKEQVDKGFKLFIVIVSVFQFVVVGTFCYFVTKYVYQFLFIFLSFIALRCVLGNSQSYHCKTIINCTTLACLIFSGSTKLSLPTWSSILINVLLGCLIAYMMYVMYYFIKYTNSQAVTLHKHMMQEELELMISNADLSDLEKDVLFDYYVKDISLDKISEKHGYSLSGMNKIKKKAINKILDL